MHRHAPDVVSLVFGTLFAGLALTWLLSATEVIDDEQAWIAGPVTLIVAGVLGLVVALRPSRPDSASAPWSTAPPIAPTALEASEPTTPIDTEDADDADEATGDRSDE
jgi:hypothetical protein